MLVEFIPLGFIIVFWITCFFYTKSIYKSRYFLLFISIFLLLGLAVLLFPDYAYKKNLPFGSFIFFSYGLLLLSIKRYYHKLNKWLIGRKGLSETHQNKDFTFVTSSEYGSIWDEEKERKPSWLDHTLSLSLEMLPILMSLGITVLFNQVRFFNIG